MAEQEQDRAEHAHKGQREVVDEADGRTGDAAVIIGVVIGRDGFLVFLVEAMDHGLFLVIGLRRLESGDHFLDEAVHLAQGAAALAEERARL